MPVQTARQPAAEPELFGKTGAIERIGDVRRPAAVAGIGIALAGLALIALGAITAMAWQIGLLSYSLWAIAGLGVAAFFLAINGRLPFAK